jgi:hypothetical protein
MKKLTSFGSFLMVMANRSGQPLDGWLMYTFIY